MLHADLKGYVTDVETGKSLESAKVKLYPVNDSTSTDSAGKYVFLGLAPDKYDYEIEASQYHYFTSKVDANINGGEINEINLGLVQTPIMEISDTYLDFGFETSTLTFTAKNTNWRKLIYILEPSQTWISVSSRSEEFTDEPMTITVNINRSDVSDLSYKEYIKVSAVYEERTYETNRLNIYVNPLKDIDGNYYRTVKIGDQVWMAENLNTGIMIDHNCYQTNNGIIEKYCYNGDCSLYGGYYSWNEMMQYYYGTMSDGIIRQGICPTGWRLSNALDWYKLPIFLGGYSVAGGRMKEEGTLHWAWPNTGATNESGFTSLPSGGFSHLEYSRSGPYSLFAQQKYTSPIWTALSDANGGRFYYTIFDDTGAGQAYHDVDSVALAVRCIKDSP